MANKAFRDAYESAAAELEMLLKQQEQIEERVLSLRKTMNALAMVISQHDPKGFDESYAKVQNLFDNSLTNDICRIVSVSPVPLTASEIRVQLKELGNTMTEQSNPLATIHAILNRLHGSGRAKETVKDGKKAWERYKSLSERVSEASKFTDRKFKKF